MPGEETIHYSFKRCKSLLAFILVGNEAGASGSLFPSFFHDFPCLFWLYIVDFLLLSARGHVRFGSGANRCGGIVTAVTPPDGEWHSAYEFSLTYESIFNTNKTQRGSTHSHPPSRLFTARTGESHGASPGEACCFNLGLPSAAKLKHGSALAFCLQDFVKFG